MWTNIYKKDVIKTNGYSPSHPAVDLTGGYKSPKYPIKRGVITISSPTYIRKGIVYNSPWYEIKYEDGYRVRDFHNSNVVVKAGQSVDTNTLVAYEGNTGYVLIYSNGQWREPTPQERSKGMGSHSHIEVYDPSGRLIDGTNYLSQIFNEVEMINFQTYINCINIATSVLNIREMPDTNSKDVGDLQPGIEWKCLSIANGSRVQQNGRDTSVWYLFTDYSTNKNIGWVSAAWINEVHKTDTGEEIKNEANKKFDEIINLTQKSKF